MAIDNFTCKRVVVGNGSQVSVPVYVPSVDVAAAVALPEHMIAFKRSPPKRTFFIALSSTAF